MTRADLMTARGKSRQTCGNRRWSNHGLHFVLRINAITVDLFDPTIAPEAGDAIPGLAGGGLQSCSLRQKIDHRHSAILRFHSSNVFSITEWDVI